MKDFKDSDAFKEATIQSARVGNNVESLDLWRQFIKRHRCSAEAYLNMGAVCSSMGRHKEAAANAQKALDLDPKLKEARFNLAFAVLMRGEAEKAQTLLKDLFQDYQDDPAPQFLLCVAYICRQESAPAESLFKKLTALPIGDYIGESFLDIAKRFLEASRRDYARHTLEAALKFGCVNPEMRTLFKSCCDFA